MFDTQIEGVDHVLQVFLIHVEYYLDKFVFDVELFHNSQSL